MTLSCFLYHDINYVKYLIYRKIHKIFIYIICNAIRNIKFVIHFFLLLFYNIFCIYKDVNDINLYISLNSLFA